MWRCPPSVARGAGAQRPLQLTLEPRAARADVGTQAEGGERGRGVGAVEAELQPARGVSRGTAACLGSVAAQCSALTSSRPARRACAEAAERAALPVQIIDGELAGRGRARSASPAASAASLGLRDVEAAEVHHRRMISVDHPRPAGDEREVRRSSCSSPPSPPARASTRTPPSTRVPASSCAADRCARSAAAPHRGRPDATAPGRPADRAVAMCPSIVSTARPAVPAPRGRPASRSAADGSADAADSRTALDAPAVGAAAERGQRVQPLAETHAQLPGVASALQLHVQRQCRARRSSPAARAAAGEPTRFESARSCQRGCAAAARPRGADAHPALASSSALHSALPASCACGARRRPPRAPAAAVHHAAAGNRQEQRAVLAPLADPRVTGPPSHCPVRVERCRWPSANASVPRSAAERRQARHRSQLIAIEQRREAHARRLAAAERRAAAA